MGREDLAREALTRKSAVTGQIGDLDAQHAQLQGEEEKLTLASQRLQAKVESFRTRKETIKATYTAAEAQTRIGEAFSGISEEMGDVGLAVQRAEDKTQQMQARAGAIDELIASGALDDASSINRGDDISRELEAMSSQADVEAELAALKGGSPQAIEAAGDPGHRDPAQDVARPSPARRRSRRDSRDDRPHPGRGTARGGRRPARDAQRARPRGRVGHRVRRRGRLPGRADRAARRRTHAPARRSPRTPSRTPT